MPAKKNIYLHELLSPQVISIGTDSFMTPENVDPFWVDVIVVTAAGHPTKTEKPTCSQHGWNPKDPDMS